MQIGIPAESLSGETRVAATPETVKKLLAGGHHRVLVQAGAGLSSSISDGDFAAAGATVVAGAVEAWAADIVLKVRGPQDGELSLLRRDQVLVALLAPYKTEALQALAATGATGFAMEWLPRISRAQSMDVLSSQANIAGYKAVLMAANAYGRLMPMLMTAAGTIKAARVVVMGVG
ncbi:MAG: NAD(P)(+) transhydrogenase (Re/Si-specific) subunit alpha, partial [Betaproteobacteria bacterium]